MPAIVNKPEHLYCAHCGAHINSESKFCFNCGKEVLESYSKKIVKEDKVDQSKVEKVIHPFWATRPGRIIRWAILLPIAYGLTYLLMESTYEILEPNSIIQYIIYSYLIYLIAVLSFKISPNKKSGFYILVPVYCLITLLIAFGSNGHNPIMMWQTLLAAIFFFTGFWMKLKNLKLKDIFK